MHQGVSCCIVIVVTYASSTRQVLLDPQRGKKAPNLYIAFDIRTGLFAAVVGYLSG